MMQRCNSCHGRQLQPRGIGGVVDGREVHMTENRPNTAIEDEQFAEAVRRTAYFLWQQDGEPDGRHEEYYLRALDMHRRQRDYDRWLTAAPVDDSSG